MWRERSRQLDLGSHEVRRFVGILVAAIVTTYCNRAREGRRGKERISLTKRYFMAEKQVLVLMKLVIFANHRPNVLARIAHRVFRKTSFFGAKAQFEMLLDYISAK